MEVNVVVEAESLVKEYGKRRVLDNVSLQLAAGDRVALTGPSGSGKSTLLNCIGGIDRPDSGRLVVGGRDLFSLDGDGLAALRREVVSTVFQFFHLLPTLSARENITFPLQLLGLSQAERDARVDELLAAVGLADLAEANPDTMSGGEQQRVAIARALAVRPRVLLADEPTGNLDSKTGDVILDLLESLTAAHSIALLLVTHSHEATRICQRVCRLHDGCLEET